MPRASKKDLRTLKEKAEKRTFDYFKEEFYKFYIIKLFQQQKDVMFAYSKAVEKADKYAYFNFNKKYKSLMVYLNFHLVDEPRTLIKLTAQRMALKISLYKQGYKFSEMSPEYLAGCQQFKLWNYGPYPETPQKWHVYKCALCGRNMAVFPKKLPNNNELTSGKMKTPWHKKSLTNTAETGGKPHQGNYAYAGNLELKNSELQEILYIMQKSNEFTKGFTDNTLKYETDDFDEDEWL